MSKFVSLLVLGLALTAVASAIKIDRIRKVASGEGCVAIKGSCILKTACNAATSVVQSGLCPGNTYCCVPKATPTPVVVPTTPVVTPTTPVVTPTTPTEPANGVPASASGLEWCSNNGATHGSYDGVSPLLNVKNQATTWELIASKSYDSEAGNPYRVARDAYSSIDSTDARLVSVASSNGVQRLHKVCAARFNALAKAAAAANIGILKVQSGWREHPYHNDYAYYCKQMKIAYPTKTCAQAGAVKAFKSPHETGLAFDLGSPSPFMPTMATNDAQKRSKGFAWMKANAHLYGVTPYKNEAWHWECVIPREAFVKGCEFTANYNTRVLEKRTKDGGLVSSTSAWSA